ncbi:MAG: ester cyclase [Dehalococcoidia bacterium]
MLSKEKMREVVLEHVEAENANDPARVVATYSETDPVFEDVPSGGRYVGGEQIVGNYRHLWDGFPGLRRQITRWTFGEDSVVIELTLSGKHEGRFRGIGPTGRETSLRVIAHFQFDDEGRIKQETAYYDSLSFLRQLGARPPG